VSVLALALILVWSAVTMLLDAWRRRRRRRDLAERLLPYQSPTVADEAQEWLQRQG
jgi:hypothetical protein